MLGEAVTKSRSRGRRCDGPKQDCLAMLLYDPDSSCTITLTAVGGKATVLDSIDTPSVVHFADVKGTQDTGILESPCRFVKK